MIKKALNDLANTFPICFMVSFLLWFPYSIYANISPQTSLESFLPFIPIPIIVRFIYVVMKG